MLAKLLLFMTYFCVTNAYFLNHTIRCPGDTVERNYRGKARCRSIQEYHCLYDDFFNMAEICQSYRQLPKGSYPRYSSFGDNIYYDPCLEGTFQHGPPKSYHLTECLFQKSKCVSEGQISCNGGTPSTDSTCKCDYKNKFYPVSNKCCSPTSEDDCSCYKNDTKCTENEEFDRDYNCIPKCQSGFQRQDGSNQCKKIQNQQNKNQPSTSGQYLTESQYTREYSYVEYDIILGVMACVYLLQFFGILIYNFIKENIRPIRFKVVPFVLINVGVLLCHGISIFVKEKVSCFGIILVFFGMLIAWFFLVIYIFLTSDIAKPRLVYNEEYDLRLFRLLKAASKGHLDTLHTLKAEDYVDMDDTDYDNRSALHLAAVEGQVEAVEYILKHHMCYTDAVDRWNRTAADDIIFHTEANGKSPDMVKNYGNILEKIQKYKQTTKQKPPKKHFREIKAVEIITAAETGEMHTLKRLKKSKTDMNLSNSKGRTALHAAAEKGKAEVVDFLLDECEVSPFVRYMGRRPIDVVDHDDKSDIHSKLKKKMNEILQETSTEKLQQDNALQHDVEMQEQVDKELQIVRLLNAASRGDIKKIKLYWKLGYKMNLADYDKRTALHVAVSDDQEHVVDFLLSIMKDEKDRKDRWGTMPCTEATKFGKDVVHQMFLKHYPELVDTENDLYRTYLLLSAGASGDVETLQKLFDKKVDMELRDYDGRTALHLAVAEDKKEAVEFLLNVAKVRTNIPDRENRKPIDSVKSDDIMEMIEKAETGLTDRASEVPKLTNSEETLLLVLKAAAKGDLHTMKTNQFMYFPMDNCDYFKNTPLHIAAAKAKLADVEYLLNERKVSPFVRNSFSKTPLQLVQKKIKFWDKREKVATLAKIEALDKSISKKTPIKNKPKRRRDFDEIKNVLEQAMIVGRDKKEEDENFKKHNKEERTFLFLNKAYKGDIKAIRRYLNTDIEMLNQTDYDKRTALHLAAAEGHTDLVQFLLDKGCNKKVEDRWGCKPLNEAMKIGDEKMMALLEY